MSFSVRCALALTAALSLLASMPCAIAAGLKTSAAPASVVATTAPKKLAIVGDGKSAASIVEGARKVVPAGWEARPASELKLAGSTTALWKALGSPKLRKQALKNVRDALAKSDLDAALLVTVTTTKKSRLVQVLLVVRGEDDVALEEMLTLPAKAGKEDEGALRGVIVAPLEQRAPKPPSPVAEVAPEGEATTSGPPATTVAGDGGKDGSDGATTSAAGTEAPGREPMLIVGAAGELATRRFTYDGATIGGLRPYNLPNVAAIGVAVELYPLRDSASIVSGLGIAADFHSSIGLRSTSVGSNEQSTGSWTRFDGMLRWWLPLSASRVTALGLSAGYGQERFSFSPPTPDLPSVAYRYARAGVELRARLGKGDPARGAAVFVGGSYLLVFSGGDVSSHFRRVQTWGLEMTGGLAVYLSAAIELRLAVDYRRFSMRFGGAQPGDPYIAAGALDEMARTLVELRVRY
ncbi:MAG: hypothetical protein ABI175_14085 [Polyangiales bacterium]